MHTLKIIRPTSRATPRVSFARRFRAVLCLSSLALTVAVSAQDRGRPEKHQKRAEHLQSRAGSSYWKVLGESHQQPTQGPAPPKWTALGPTDYILGPTLEQSVSRLGRINALAFHPTDPAVVYAATPASGPWKLETTGWRPLADATQMRIYPELMSTSGIAVDHDDPDTIYVLTGDGNGGMDGIPASPSFGVMKTIDDGINWETTSLQWTWEEQQDDLYWGFRLAMDPCDSSILFAVTNQGIYRTDNGGEEWPQVQSGNFRDVEFQPTDCSQSTAVVYAATVSGVYVSTDGGKSDSWRQRPIDVPSQVISEGESDESRVELAVTPANPQWVYAVVADDDLGFVGLYRSEDAGESYKLISNAPNILGSKLMGDKAGAMAFYGIGLAVSPLDEKDIFVGCMNSWRSTDGGETWCANSFWQPLPQNPHPNKHLHADVHFMELRKNPTSEALAYDLYAATDGGVYKASRATAAPAVPAECWLPWEDLSAGLRITQSFGVCATPADPSMVYVGNQDNGTYRLGGPKECHGQTMGPTTGCSVANGDGGDCLIGSVTGRVAYLSKEDGRIYRSTDQGESIVSAGPVGADVENQYLTVMAMEPFDSNVLYGCYVDLWKTTDGGMIWGKMSNGALGSEGCVAVVVTRRHKDEPGVVYVAKKVSSGKLPVLYWSRDEGVSWTSMSLPEPKLAAAPSGYTYNYGQLYVGTVDIAGSAADPNLAWVTAVANDAVDNFGVYAVNAEKTTIQKIEHRLAMPNPGIHADLTNARALSIVYAGEQGDLHRLFVATQVGVLYGECSDLSCCWWPYMYLPLNIQDLHIVLEADGTPSTLVAASFGQGVWELKDPLDYRSDVQCTGGGS